MDTADLRRIAGSNEEGDRLFGNHICRFVRRFALILSSCGERFKAADLGNLVARDLRSGYVEVHAVADRRPSALEGLCRCSGLAERQQSGKGDSDCTPAHALSCPVTNESCVTAWPRAALPTCQLYTARGACRRYFAET